MRPAISPARVMRISMTICPRRSRPLSGRHPLPDPAALAEKLGEWGIDNSKQVVVYDDSFGAMASRLWWLLRWLGHETVALLDGGLPQMAARRAAGDRGVAGVISRRNFSRRSTRPVGGCRVPWRKCVTQDDGW